MSLISVIIPSYNQESYIIDAVESVLAQTYTDCEIIVVDDGSIDNTHARLTSYFDRIRYLHQANKGLSGARNAGLAASHGDYILFLDGDDLLRSDALEKLSCILDQSPDDGLVYSAWQQVSADDKSVLSEIHPRQVGHLLKSLLLREFFFFGSSTLIRRSVLEQVGPFDETLTWGDDADMWLRIGLAGWSFGYLDEPILQYRVHHASMTATVSTHQIESWQAGLRKFFAMPDLTPELRSLEKQACAVLYFETAGRYFRAGEYELGRELLCQALQVNGIPDTDWFLNWLAGTALDPRTGNPIEFIERIFDQLPPEAIGLRTLRRRAQGRYHTAASFTAHLSHNSAAVRQHILPALLNDPTNIANRGFMKVAFNSLLQIGD